MVKQCLLILGLVILAIIIYYPARHARHYEYIKTEDIYNTLEIKNSPYIGSNLKKCDYLKIIINNEDIEINSVSNVRNFSKPLVGGEFIPSHCYPLTKTAVIVPYRRRTEQLKTFLNYIHPFLQSQQLHYRIFIVEQNDTLPFNRAKMLNYGAKIAIEHNFDCLILQDVDLIPINTGNIYACTKMPRHMSSSLDTFRFNLPYLTLFGGAVAIQSKQFQKVNGMSNLFYGWGGEDDDFCRRLIAENLEPCRFPPEISRYTMLLHEKEPVSKERYDIMERAKGMTKEDGLSSLSKEYVIVLEKLYTHILAS